MKTLKKILIFFKLYKFALASHKLITSLIIRFHLLNPHRLVTRDHVVFQLDLGKTIDMHIFRDSWEPWIIDALKKLLKQGDIVVEAGANIGAHSLIIGKIVGQSGRLYCFEPTNYAFEKLQINIDLNNLKAVIRPEQIVLTNLQYEMPITSMVSDFKLGAKDNEFGEDITGCQVISIDNYVEENQIQTLRLMKIDVDGYDYKVLAGAKKTIIRSRPIILIELANFTLKRQGDSVKDIYTFLADLSYVGFYLSTPTNNNYMYGLKINSPEEILRISGDSSHVDSIFLPAEKANELHSLVFN